MDFSKFIRSIQDYPKPGIVFRDITPLLLDYKILRKACNEMANCFLEDKIDVVAGIESRGFLFGVPIAFALEAGFVPIRKSGKLPGDTFKEEYSLEYGTDVLEIHKGQMPENSRVLIVDDLLATGGTIHAASRLVEKAGGKVAGFSFLIELSFLNGRNNLGQTRIFSLIDYKEE